MASLISSENVLGRGAGSLWRPCREDLQSSGVHRHRLPGDLAQIVFQVLGSMLLGLSVGGGVFGCSASGWWAMPAICLFWISLWLLSGDVSFGREEE